MSNQYDLGFFAQDDWRDAAELHASALGLRYETQNNIGDHKDFAPRVGIAWGFGRRQVAPSPRPCCARRLRPVLRSL